MKERRILQLDNPIEELCHGGAEIFQQELNYRSITNNTASRILDERKFTISHRRSKDFTASGS